MGLFAAAISKDDGSLTTEQIDGVLDALVLRQTFADQRVLLIVPDNTRTAPIGPLFRGLHARLGSVVKQLDVLIALGTHPPLDDAAINVRLGISTAERSADFSSVRIFNHAFDDSAELVQIATSSQHTWLAWSHDDVVETALVECQ